MVTKEKTRHVVVVDYGPILFAKLRQMADENNITMSLAARLLVGKALAAGDRKIIVSLPE